MLTMIYNDWCVAGSLPFFLKCIEMTKITYTVEQEKKENANTIFCEND
jgi:hypothetical protein